MHIITIQVFKFQTVDDAFLTVFKTIGNTFNEVNTDCLYLVTVYTISLSDCVFYRLRLTVLNAAKIQTDLDGAVGLAFCM